MGVKACPPLVVGKGQSQAAVRGRLPLFRCEVVCGPVERSHLYCVLATCERGFLVFKPSLDPEKAVGGSRETCGCCVPRGVTGSGEGVGSVLLPYPRGGHPERSWLGPECHVVSPLSFRERQSRRRGAVAWAGPSSSLSVRGGEWTARPCSRSEGRSAPYFTAKPVSLRCLVLYGRPCQMAVLPLCFTWSAESFLTLIH